MDGSNTVDHFRTQHFALFRSGLDRMAIARLREHLDTLIFRNYNIKEQNNQGTEKGISLSVDEIVTHDAESIRSGNSDSAGLLILNLGKTVESIAENLTNRQCKVAFTASIFRRQLFTDGSLHLPYHQDARVVGHGGRSVTFWVPLSDGAGSKSPGLELLAGISDEILYPVDGSYYFQIRPDVVERLEAESTKFAPEINMGDFFVFHDTVVHRTYVRPEMTEPRCSIEFRVMISWTKPWQEVRKPG